ncbi:hypothetical protein FQA47_013656 [Oryzias melastigma]|uniref:Uncharacterized protein n=1 Tax=Oryzias melastigma TaxID=30732 RepID=A0A834BSH6_ORYME|nr:hypothetical protein FQA47_013656 [Oryzias melastigma]
MRVAILKWSLKISPPFLSELSLPSIPPRRSLSVSRSGRGRARAYSIEIGGSVPGVCAYWAAVSSAGIARSVLSRWTFPPLGSSGAAAAGTRAVTQTASRWLRFGAPPSVQSFTCRLLTSEQREANVRESSSAPRGEAGKCTLTEEQGRLQKQIIEGETIFKK